MTKKQFEQERQKWMDEWYDKWSVLDLDFEHYMVMKGMTPEMFYELNNVGRGESDFLSESQEGKESYAG